MKHKEPCRYCEERPTLIIDRSGLKLSLDEDGDIVVSINLGSATTIKMCGSVNYCPMCGRKLEDV